MGKIDLSKDLSKDRYDMIHIDHALIIFANTIVMGYLLYLNMKL